MPTSWSVWPLIEMARAAGSLATRSEVTRISNAVWGHPVRVDDDRTTVSTSLMPQQDGSINLPDHLCQSG